jgi:hypothetical protein
LAHICAQNVCTLDADASLKGTSKNNHLLQGEKLRAARRRSDPDTDCPRFNHQQHGVMNRHFDAIALCFSLSPFSRPNAIRHHLLLGEMHAPCKLYVRARCSPKAKAGARVYSDSMLRLCRIWISLAPGHLNIRSS